MPDYILGNIYTSPGTGPLEIVAELACEMLGGYDMVVVWRRKSDGALAFESDEGENWDIPFTHFHNFVDLWALPKYFPFLESDVRSLPDRFLGDNPKQKKADFIAEVKALIG